MGYTRAGEQIRIMKKERKERGRGVRRESVGLHTVFLTHIFYVQYLIIPKPLFLTGSLSTVVVSAASFDEFGDC